MSPEPPASVDEANRASTTTASSPTRSGAAPAPDATPRIDEAYAARRTTGTRVLDTIGQVLTFPFRALADLGGIIMSGLRELCTTVVTLLVDAVLAFLSALGVDVSGAAETARKVINSIFAVPFGLIEGALRAPEIAVGSAFAFMRGFFSFRWVTDGREALRTLFQPLTGAVATALSPLYSTAKGIDEIWSPPERITGRMREQLLQDFPPEIVDRVRVHSRGFMRDLFLSLGASAQTQGYDVYVADGEASASTMRHELVHVLQMRDTPGRFGSFTGDYFATLFSYLIAGPPPEHADPWLSHIGQAYAAIPAEREAFELARLSVNARR